MTSIRQASAARHPEGRRQRRWTPSMAVVHVHQPEHQEAAATVRRRLPASATSAAQRLGHRVGMEVHDVTAPTSDC